MSGVLEGLSVYAFGDSILYGHSRPQTSMLRLMAGRYGWKLSMFARNGATILPGENQILQQIYAAPNDAPDLIVFDGYTNDAYGSKENDPFNKSKGKPDITTRYGVIQGSRAAAFDQDTFCGAFEALLDAMKRKWHKSRIVYLTIHKSGARDFSIQSRLRDLSVKICGQWGVAVADAFVDTELDTRRTEDMSTYIIDGNGSHPNEECCKKFYIPTLTTKLISMLKRERPDGPDAFDLERRKHGRDIYFEPDPSARDGPGIRRKGDGPR